MNIREALWCVERFNMWYATGSLNPEKILDIYNIEFRHNNDLQLTISPDRSHYEEWIAEISNPDYAPSDAWEEVLQLILDEKIRIIPE